eukprot:m.210274 g.210274  ORF g.210274 m.210274 type:complete len:293 (+) comp39743_c0_seq9:980-1858(+)
MAHKEVKDQSGQRTEAVPGGGASHEGTTTFVAMIGTMEPFDAKSDEWTAYVERLDEFFLANGLDGPDPRAARRRVAVFSSFIGSETYRLLKRLVEPGRKPSSYSYEDLCKLLSTHLAPKPLEITERLRIRQRRQQQGESVADFMAALRALAEHCGFGQDLNMQLRDNFVAGLRHKDIQKKLVGMANLTLAKAIEVAQGMEAAEAQSVPMRAISESTFMDTTVGTRNLQRSRRGNATAVVKRATTRTLVGTKTRFVHSATKRDIWKESAKEKEKNKAKDAKEEENQVTLIIWK